MKREIDAEFHKNIEGKIIESLSYSCSEPDHRVSYMSIYFTDGTRLDVGLDCTHTHHSMGFYIHRWKQIDESVQKEKL